MEAAQILQGWSRETTLVRDAEGRWFHDGQPLEQRNLSRAFDRWVARAQDGRYCLKNDINWAYITLHGAPYFVRAVRIEPEGGASVLLSNDDWEPLRGATLRFDRAGVPYCDVASNSKARATLACAPVRSPRSRRISPSKRRAAARRCREGAAPACWA